MTVSDFHLMFSFRMCRLLLLLLMLLAMAVLCAGDVLASRKSQEEVSFLLYVVILRFVGGLHRVGQRHNGGENSGRSLCYKQF